MTLLVSTCWVTDDCIPRAFFKIVLNWHKGTVALSSNTYPFSLRKRLFDLALSGVSMVLLAPIFILAIIVIVRGDRGPLLFKQDRVGVGGESFPILKFRTMRLADDAGGSTTTSDDPRLFSGAHMLRRFKIDELPQLFNVLNGTMSLVGPRPTVRDDYDRMTPEQRQRASVRPGITGLAQVSGNTGLPWSKRIEYDLQYVQAASLWLDLKILAKTGLMVVTGKAETHPATDDEWEDR